MVAHELQQPGNGGIAHNEGDERAHEHERQRGDDDARLLLAFGECAERAGERFAHA